MKETNEKAMNDLKRYFARKGYAKTTEDRWNGIANEFLGFLERNGKTMDDIGDLLNSEGKVVSKEPFGAKEYLDTKTKYETSYLYYLHIVLSGFYSVWEKHFPIDADDFPKPKKEPKRPILTTEQLLMVANTAKKIWIERTEIDKNDMIGLRDYTMVLISVEHGVRRHQISMLNVDHYDEKKGILFVPAAKGGRDRDRPLSNTLKNVLTYYVQRRKMIDTKDKAMFILGDGERITVSAMSDRFRGILERAGVYSPGVGFHASRRRKSLRLKELGFSEEERNDIFGWKVGSHQSHIYGTLDQEKVQRKAADLDNILDKANSKKEEEHS